MRNIILICLDTVRQDHFMEYSSRLKERSNSIFTQCRAASSWSVPSHASMFTGKLPHQHGVHSYSPSFKGINKNETFIGELTNHRTIGVSANKFASSNFHFDELFDRFIDVNPTRRFPDGLDVKHFVQNSDLEGFALWREYIKEAVQSEHPVESLSNAIVGKMDSMMSNFPVPKLFDDGAKIVTKHALKEVQTGPEPFFMFLNVMEAHHPHQHIVGYDNSLHSAPYNWTSRSDLPPLDVNIGEYDDHDLEYFKGLYQAAIDYLDRIIANFVDELMSATDRETVVIITSDHGENLDPGTDGSFAHSISGLSEAVLHIPFTLINSPYNYGSVTEDLVSHLDLRELIEGLCTGEKHDLSSKRVRAERIGLGVMDSSSMRDAVDETTFAEWNKMVRCVYDGRKKITWDSLGLINEFEIRKDRPCWEKPIRELEEVPGFAEALFDIGMEQYINSFSNDQRTPDSLGDDVRDQLRDLGYM